MWPGCIEKHQRKRLCRHSRLGYFVRFSISDLNPTPTLESHVPSNQCRDVSLGTRVSSRKDSVPRYGRAESMSVGRVPRVVVGSFSLSLSIRYVLSHSIFSSAMGRRTCKERGRETPWLRPRLVRTETECRMIIFSGICAAHHDLRNGSGRNGKENSPPPTRSGPGLP